MGVAVTNCLLVRWANGFMEVADSGSVAAWGRIEGFLSLGQVTDPTQATLIAQAQLALTAAEQLTVTATVEPTGSGDTPYEGFDLGDDVTVPTEDGLSTVAERAASFTVAQDAEGDPVFNVELHSPALVAEQRWSQWLTQMQAGTLAGTATSATPLSPPAPPQAVANDEILAWDQPGLDPSGSPILLASGMSNELPVNRSGVLYKVVVVLQGPSPGFGTGSNICTVYVNGVSVGTVTVTAGNQQGTGFFNAPVMAAGSSTPSLVSVDFTTVDGVATGAHILASVS